MGKKNKDTDGALDILAVLGHVTTAESGASIGISIDQDDLSLTQAKDHLIKSRIRVTLSAVADDDEQTGDMFVEPYRGVADFHKASVDQHTISGRLSFKCDEQSRKQLLDFDGRKVRLVFKREGVAGEDAAGQAALSGEPEDTSGDVHDADGVLIRKGRSAAVA